MMVKTLLNPWRPDEGTVELALNEALAHWKRNFDAAHKLSYEMEEAMCELHFLILPGEPYLDWQSSVKRIKEVLEQT